MSFIQSIRCRTCGAVNRVPEEKLKQNLTPVCGRCKTPLVVSANGKPIVVSDTSFATEVEQSALPVLLDMWAPWCGPCRTLAPIIDEVASVMSGRIKVGKLNVDENPVIASRFRVSSIPTMLVFRNGREVDRIVGLQPKAQIIQRLQTLAG